jgi:hypothetical protein
MKPFYPFKFDPLQIDVLSHGNILVEAIPPPEGGAWPGKWTPARIVKSFDPSAVGQTILFFRSVDQQIDRDHYLVHASDVVARLPDEGVRYVPVEMADVPMRLPVLQPQRIDGIGDAT